jgi:C-terminal processing protease CtpA/Prc
MSRIPAFLLATFLTAVALPAAGQFKTNLINYEGAEAPCVGIGPIGGPIAKKCVEAFVQVGFFPVDEVGVTGFAVGTAGKDDGVITRVDVGSPAAEAGLVVGDAVVAVDDKPVRPTPGVIATRRSFGERGEDLHMKVRRGGTEVDIKLTRAAQNAPPGPKSPSFFISLKPLINWRGQFVPCMGAGPAGFATIAYCEKHFKPFGYIKAGEMGKTGFEVDLKRVDSARIAAVEAGSPAAAADLKVDDEIVSIEGQPLTANVGEAVNEHVFGKAGDHLQIRVHRGETDKTVSLTLAAKPKG